MNVAGSCYKSIAVSRIKVCHMMDYTYICASRIFEKESTVNIFPVVTTRNSTLQLMSRMNGKRVLRHGLVSVCS